MVTLAFASLVTALLAFTGCLLEALALGFSSALASAGSVAGTISDSSTSAFTTRSSLFLLLLVFVVFVLLQVIFVLAQLLQLFFYLCFWRFKGRHNAQSPSAAVAALARRRAAAIPSTVAHLVFLLPFCC